MSSSSSSDSGSENDDITSRVLRKSKKTTHEADDTQPITTSQSTFDAYFTQSATRARTSSNVFSSLVLPLTQDEYTNTINSYESRTNARSNIILPAPDTLARYTREIDEGFNLLFYGLGSKRRVLNDYATTYLAKKGHVIVVNGFAPGVGIKDMLTSIEDVIASFGTTLGSGGGLEGQTQRIYDYFVSMGQRKDGSKSRDKASRPLYLVMHNIDAPSFRTSKAHSALSYLALNPYIHVVASVDKLNSPLLWSSSEIVARKHEPESATSSNKGGRRGFAWLFHDLTTLASYDAELSWADRTSISGASSSRKGTSSLYADGLGGRPRGNVDETAALHVLASVTQKAKKLFVMLGKRQVDWEDESAGNRPSASTSTPTKSTTNAPSTPSHAVLSSGAPPSYALPYSQLFNLAREQFLATSDTALRALLGEFRDHGLVVSSAAGEQGAEVMWIPMRTERLVRVLETLGDA